MDSNAVCLHNATVYAGFSVMKNCAVYIKDGKIADVYNERRFKQKKFSPQVRIIDLMGASLLPGFVDTHIHGSGGYSTDDALAGSHFENVRISGGKRGNLFHSDHQRLA